MADQKRPNLHLQRLRMVLICCLQPFFYGGATRAPLIYAGLYGYFGLGLPWWEVGLLIATYQICRALANLLIPIFGMAIYHVLGVAIGLAGYAEHATATGKHTTRFWFALGMIGLSEVITCMQHYVKVEYTRFGVPVLRERLRLQYACNVAGTAVSFIVAGFLNDIETGPNNTVIAADTHKDGYWGIALQAAELTCTLVYFALVKFWPNESAPTDDFATLLFPPDKLAGEEADDVDTTKDQADSKPTEVHQVTLTALNGGHDEEPAISLPKDNALAANVLASLTSLGVDVMNRVKPEELKRVFLTTVEEDEKDPGVPWINYMIVLTFAIQALCIGTLLSTAPILLFSEYQFDVDWIGLVFGCGEILGTVCLFYLVPASSQKAVRKYFPGPLNMLIIVGTLGSLALFLAIHNLASSIVFIVLIMGCNDFGTALTAEAQGATVAPQHYSRMNAYSNIARRVGNTVTAALGPIMFGVVYYLPFVTFGALTVVWIVVMAFAFHRRGKQMAAVLESEETGLNFYLRSNTFISAELDARKKIAGDSEA